MYWIAIFTIIVGGNNVEFKEVRTFETQAGCVEYKRQLDSIGYPLQVYAGDIVETNCEQVRVIK